MTKTVQVSSDDITYYTLPGNTGDFKNSASQIKDTVFGQNFESNTPGINSWSVTANGLWKGFAGYKAKLLLGGTPTTFTGEAMTHVSGQIYQITNAVKNIWDTATAVVVYDGVTDVTTQVLSIDYLTGKVTFKGSYTVLGSVTADGKYIPYTAALGAADKYTLKQTATAINKSDFANVQANGGYAVFVQGLQKVSLDLSGFYDVTPALRAKLNARSTLIIEIDPSGNGWTDSVARGFFRETAESQAGQVGALETESATFDLQVPSTDYLPFEWNHGGSTTLSTAVQKVLDAWSTQSLIYVQYLYDGTNGIKGQAVVTDVSLSGGLDAMNDFAFTFQGTDATTDVGTG